MKVLEVKFKSSQEINRGTISQEPNEIDIEYIPQEKTPVTIDMIMNVICSLNQEGLGPVKWWENQ